MKTYFISDLHLSDSRPDLTDLFLDFMQNQAPEAEAVYILGDFFDFWIGDDEYSAISNTVQQAIVNLVDSGVPCYFLHGNRDFLLGQKYADRCKMAILDEHHVINLYGVPTMLCHGDTLCLDDVEYQRFRRIVHKKWLQKLFSWLPLKLRIKIGSKIRNTSKGDKLKKAADIMDANNEFVLECFDKYKVTCIIHGHTHRQGIHDYQINGVHLQRIVLGDWGETASILEINPQGMKFNLER